MTIFKPPVYQIHTDTYGTLKSLYINTSLTAFFGAKSVVTINHCNAACTSSAFVKVSLTCKKW